jgi:glycosyltransferase involved in cell wall biosynthesis
MKEGWGITNIESNACGTPTVSANVPGLKDSVKDGYSGLLYKYGDIEDLTFKLLQLLKNQNILDLLSSQSVEWAKQFSWDDSADIMEGLCKKIINN